ncbi:hypothetical protein BAUCODRAFT_36861 [Baudoinia panamericana UAMH 10762]|uniref:Uncharacterized protein n=1 Tax=Baudoinia panamericana (strain UAMH 10762) TaxID=717646 RepID=M2LGJ0_BAUPA|nr:uncharacterized protein BAUCODRAFT_36861 [Baudoinia panamericana UAMH 10762]EMC93192.1 hypothetical protein BAUCODRAFT_36861 [Baudoinia panamericana UAMH 10762]
MTGAVSVNRSESRRRTGIGVDVCVDLVAGAAESVPPTYRFTDEQPKHFPSQTVPLCAL